MCHKPDELCGKIMSEVATLLKNNRGAEYKMGDDEIDTLCSNSRDVLTL